VDGGDHVHSHQRQQSPLRCIHPDGLAGLNLVCPTRGSQVTQDAEHMSGGSGDDGTVYAGNSYCDEKPGVTLTVPSRGSFTDWGTFHNVPWPGSEVSLTWGQWGTSPSVYPFVSGEACVFDAPAGVTSVAGKEFGGHVGWGFELPSGYWEFGANEGPRLPLLISKTWYATGTWQQMLNAFRDEGHYHSAKFYTQYRCASVKTTSRGITAAGTTVLKEFNELYAIPGQDCEAQAFNVLDAYGVGNMPSDLSISYWPSPNNWFNHLTNAQFGGVARL
jgi:hypothetical protein